MESSIFMIERSERCRRRLTAGCNPNSCNLYAAASMYLSTARALCSSKSSSPSFGYPIRGASPISYARCLINSSMVCTGPCGFTDSRVGACVIVTVAVVDMTKEIDQLIVLLHEDEIFFLLVTTLDSISTFLNPKFRCRRAYQIGRSLK